MPDDWEWFWAGEHGRDTLLRSEVENLHSAASQARSQAATLSSRLAQVQGSLESRLSALATAFDAYVELGDVREQLAGYPDTSAVRRDAARALEVLTRGGVPAPLTSETSEYWLADGMNAVIALAGGEPDPTAEARAVALDREAELFIVAAAGSLGHGPRVGPRVPPLLVTDGELTVAQRALWTAVLTGEYGDVLAAVEEPWRPALHGPEADWLGWVCAEARTSTPLETLRWVERQAVAAAPTQPTTVDGSATAATTPVAAADLLLARPSQEPTTLAQVRTTARSALATVALTLIGRGLGEEVALLERARELRARIETPGEQPAGRPRAGATSTPVTVLTQVRAAFLAAAPGSPRRAELLRWIQPGLATVVDRCVADAEAQVPVVLEARTPGGGVVVGPAGVPAEQRAKAESRIRERYAPTAAATRLAPALAAAVFLIATLLLGGFGRTGLAVLTGLATGAAVVVLIRALLAERRRRHNLQSDLELTAHNLAQVEAGARQQESARLDTVAEVRRLASGLHDRLAALVA